MFKVLKVPQEVVLKVLKALKAGLLELRVLLDQQVHQMLD